MFLWLTLNRSLVVEQEALITFFEALQTELLLILSEFKRIGFMMISGGIKFNVHN